MKVALRTSGPGVEAPPFLGYVLLADLVLAGLLVLLGPLAARAGWFPRHPWAPWLLVALGVLLAAADVSAGRMSPRGLTWRRRLGYLAMGLAVWRGGPVESAAVAVAVILYMGFVWVALVVGGRALSRAIAGATGEDKPE